MRGRAKRGVGMSRDTLSRPEPVARRAPDGARPARRISRTEARNARAAAGFVLPFLALLALCFLAPIVYAVYQSLPKTGRTGPLCLCRQEYERSRGRANYAHC